MSPGQGETIDHRWRLAVSRLALGSGVVAQRAGTQMASDQTAPEIPERWRSLERQLRYVDQASIDAELILVEAGQLRDEYERAVAEAIDHGQPRRPPFSEA
jgi:hypothetical protein